MKYILTILLLFTTFSNAQSFNPKLITDLRGNWKFEIGDNKQWADPKFDDSKWDEIFAPADWENEGYPGYDGYAWYRKTFTVPSSAQNKNIFAHVGYIDDVCAVYVNGALIGEGGSFPPRYATEYNINHEFFIPSKFLRVNQNNVIAIRVFDDHLHGGIVGGKVGIFEHPNVMPFIATFPEFWKLNEGDESEWKEPDFDDSKWQDVIVPAKWDFQGHRGFDGIAWYRVEFNVPADLKDKNYVLMLGKIDDLDETFLNGKLIGRTGRIRMNGTVRETSDEYTRYRCYRISADELKAGQKNILAIRVYDRYSWGGIYEGPLGIVKENDFKRLEDKFDSDNNNRYDNRNNFERFMDKLFNDN